MNTRQDQSQLIASAIDSARLQVIDRCATAEGNLRAVSTARDVPSNAMHVVEYIKIIAPIKDFMETNRVTMEQALVAVGDVPMPFKTREGTDPFNGCLIEPGSPYSRSRSEKSSASPTDDWVFRWSPKEVDKIYLETLEKYLPEKERTLEIRFILQSALSMGNALDARASRGDLKLLQYIRATQEGYKLLILHASQFREQLQQNLDQAKARDQVTLQAITAGLAAATAGIAATAPTGYQGSPNQYEQEQLILQLKEVEIQRQMLRQQPDAEFRRSLDQNLRDRQRELQRIQ
jgi:hypothetical protein